MIKKALFFLCCLFFFTNKTLTIELSQSPYFNTKFLANYDLVEEVLIKQEGFQPIQFPSSDGVILDGLLLTKKNARATIIFCAGFFPGRKEGQAHIFKMLPPNYNILFFNARGHGNSDGRFWSTLNKYGKHEYKDVLGALELVEKYIGGDIILYGVCAGAFHASHALIKLSKNKKKSNVVGFIFDSGFASSITVSNALSFHMKEKIIPSMLRWYANKKIIRQTKFYKISSWFMSTFLNIIKNIFFMPNIRKIEPETNLFDKMHNIECPVFFIHSKNDNYAPYADVIKLFSTIKYKTCWWIEQSTHAAHALKHKYEYQKQFMNFLDFVLTAQNA